MMTQAVGLSLFLGLLFPIGNSAPDEPQWLDTLATEMGSVEFTRKDAEARLELRSDRFESLTILDTHPALSGCEKFLSVEIQFKLSSRPTLAEIEGLLGEGTELPIFPDDFSAKRHVAFYPTAEEIDMSVRVIVTLGRDVPNSVVEVLIDREVWCRSRPSRER